MPFVLAGLGTALPTYSIDQADAAAIVEPISCEAPEHRRLLPILYRRSGVARRHSVVLERPDGTLTQRQSFFPPRLDASDQGPTTAARMQRYAAEALPLATHAATSALNEAQLSAERLTHLVTVSCSGFAAPGWDIGLIDTLGLDRGIARTHVGFMGCHGALNGLRVAKAFADAHPAAVVLVTALELCSLHHRYGWEPERVVTNALFADGAAATVGFSLNPSAATGEARDAPLSQAGSGSEAGPSAPLVLVASGSFVVPDTADAMTWQIGDHGFEMTLSPRVPDLIQHSLRPWLEEWLGASGLTLREIGSWAVHPGGPRILSATAEALGLSQEALAVSRSVLREYGNMSSPTVLFLLDRLRREGAATPCVALAFGPGLTIEAALLGRL
jgi:predicted naringenin-chalcone synthase